MQRAVGLVENQIVGAAEQHADGVGGGNAGDLSDSTAIELDFLNALGSAELVGREGIDVGDGSAVESLGVRRRRRVVVRER